MDPHPFVPCQSPKTCPPRYSALCHAGEPDGDCDLPLGDPIHHSVTAGPTTKEIEEEVRSEIRRLLQANPHKLTDDQKKERAIAAHEVYLYMDAAQGRWTVQRMKDLLTKVLVLSLYESPEEYDGA